MSMIFLYTFHKHLVQIWLESQFKYQSYERLLDCVSACAEHVANYFALFSERGDQMFCLYSFYISSNCINIAICLLSKSSLFK